MFRKRLEHELRVVVRGVGEVPAATHLRQARAPAYSLPRNLEACSRAHGRAPPLWRGVIFKENIS
jgi:hypothetical protein